MADLNIALAKGRLAKDTIKLFEKAGLDISGFQDESRKLVLSSGGIDIFMVKPSDVPVYVEHGVADVGVCGKDTLLENQARVYELLDLNFGECRICVCGPEGVNAHKADLKIATTYPRIANEYYQNLGESIQVIKLSGSVELGPMLGLSDVIVDIVESGRTLHDNGLAVIEPIRRISARLCVNRVSLKVKGKRINTLVDQLRSVRGERKVEEV